MHAQSMPLSISKPGLLYAKAGCWQENREESLEQVAQPCKEYEPKLQAICTVDCQDASIPVAGLRDSLHHTDHWREALGQAKGPLLTDVPLSNEAPHLPFVTEEL